MTPQSVTDIEVLGPHSQDSADDEGSLVPSTTQMVTVRNRPWVVSDVRASPIVSSDGTRIHEGRDLPAPAGAHGFDDPVRLDAFLHAVRWGAITSADSSSLQAPFRSGIEIEDYQLEPVVRALSMPRTNLLIADDVGLGKTIEIGLVM